MTAKLAEGEGVEPLPLPVARFSRPLAHLRAPPSFGTGLLPQFGRVFLGRLTEIGFVPQTLDAPCLVVPWGVEPPSVDYESTASTANASGQFGAGRGNRTLLCSAWKAGDEPFAYPQKRKKPSAEAGLQCDVCQRQNYQDGEIVPPAGQFRQAADFMIFITDETGTSAALSRSLQASKHA